MIEDGLREDILSRIAHRDLHRLHAYWQARRTGDRLPARADIHPSELRFLMGNLLLVEALREPLRFRYRLAGVNLSRFLKTELTGKLLDQHPDPEFRRQAAATYTRLVETGEPWAARRDSIVDGRLRRYEVLLLPLATDGANVDMILGAMRFKTGV
jgi:hypothetical protein